MTAIRVIRVFKALAGLIGLTAAAAAAVLIGDSAPALDTRPGVAAAAATPDAALIERGRVLALAGNCAGCHSTRGGAAYAGGPALATPFGKVYAGNLTPDAATGLGRWTPAIFWRALQHGRGFDGRRLVPAFPYTETTRITRADSDALFAWLRTLPAVAQVQRPHELRWPYGTPLALAAWRLLFFTPGPWVDDAQQGPEWNRGAYLVNGAGHCVACHGGRNALGATADAGFGGGLVPTRNWYAPAFTRASQASVADWPLDEIVALLRDGVAPRGRVNGPMAEVVQGSTQHLPESDLHAMAVYLKSLPVRPEPVTPARETPGSDSLARGERLYADHCAACHGDEGEGGVLAASATAPVAPAPASVPAAASALAPPPATLPGARVVPALAGNRVVRMEPPANLVRLVAQGGFGPATAGNPRPFGMPPFAHVLSDAEIADLLTWLRHREPMPAPPLSAFDVARWRGGSDF